MSRDEILTKIRQHVAEILEMSIDDVQASDSFVDDLHVGSLELFELAEALEEEFESLNPDFRIEDEDMPALQTSDDVADYVLAQIPQA